MSSVVVPPPDSDEYAKEITVIESTDDQAEMQLPRRKMKKGEALAEIDRSKQFSFCKCQHDIRLHEPTEDYITKLAGKCTWSECNCQGYQFSGIVKTQRELDQEIESSYSN